MSEFISICPKCRQRILCDTAYVGKRIACPLCLQEITMPEPPAGTDARPGSATEREAVVQPQPSAAAPAQTQSTAPRTAKTSGKFPVLAVVIGAVVIVLAVVGGMIVMQKSANKPTTAAAPAPVATVPQRPTTEAPAGVPQRVSTEAPNDSTAGGNNSACRAIWTFDQNRGTTVKDLSGNGNTVTLMGPDATWTTDAQVYGQALKLSKSSYAQANGPVVNTAASFTVAAWVKLNAIDLSVGYGYQTVLSIDGRLVSGFYLQFNPKVGNKFAFTRIDSDAKEGTTTVAAVSKTAVTAGTWYHLAAVYDDAAQTIALYVNGKLQQSVPFATAWQATGNTVLGRGLYNGKGADFFNGNINEVRIYASALNARKIQALAAKGAPAQE